MGYYLEGKHESRSANLFLFRALLATASAAGWQPAGTVLDEFQYELFSAFDTDTLTQERRESIATVISKWKGGYESMDFQLITENDAREIAKALYRASDILDSGEPLNVIANDPFWPGDASFLRSWATFFEAGSVRIS